MWSFTEICVFQPEENLITSVMKNLWLVLLVSSAFVITKAEVEDDFDDEDVVVEDEADVVLDDV